MYPKNITIESPRLKTLLEKKGELIKIGRAKSEEIEATEAEMATTEQALIEEEKKVDIKDLDEKSKAIGTKVDEAIAEMQEVKKEIFDRMMKQTNPELRTKYDELKKKKEELETERNKVALKAQKFNDKIIPLGKELMKPFLEDQYEDYDTLQLDGDEIVASIFSHLADFKNNYKRK